MRFGRKEADGSPVSDHEGRRLLDMVKNLGHGDLCMVLYDGSWRGDGEI